MVLKYQGIMKITMKVIDSTIMDPMSRMHNQKSYIYMQEILFLLGIFFLVCVLSLVYKVYKIDSDNW